MSKKKIGSKTHLCQWMTKKLETINSSTTHNNFVTRLSLWVSTLDAASLFGLFRITFQTVKALKFWTGFKKRCCCYCLSATGPDDKKFGLPTWVFKKSNSSWTRFFTETTQHFALWFAFLLTAAIPRHDDGQRAEFIITARKWANFYLGSNIRSHSRIFFH